MHGPATVGLVLWAVDGTVAPWMSSTHPKDPWSTPGTKKTYQWLRDGAVIPGATAEMYTVNNTDRGKKLSYRVTGSASGYKPVTRASNDSPAVHSSTPAPILSYTRLTVGSHLNAKLDSPWMTPVPVNMKYQWLRNGEPIPGETGTSYRITSKDIDQSIVLRTRGVNGRRIVETVYTAPVKPSVHKELAEMGRESGFSADPQVGTPIKVRLSVWWKLQDKVTPSFQWLRNGAVIPGARSVSYTPVAADAGKQLTVAVTGTRPGFASRTEDAGRGLPKVMPGPARAAAATITGTAKVRSVLTATKGTWQAPTQPDVKFQWLRNGKVIWGATASTYKVRTADKGTKISVRSTAIVSERFRVKSSITSARVTIR